MANAGYVLGIDNSILNLGFAVTNGSMQVFNTIVQANSSFSSPFPQVLIMKNCSFYD